jgi:hypothetical protein
MMEVMPVASQPIYQFYAELKDYKPLIWRRFQVAGNITLGDHPIFCVNLQGGV